ncbi:MAG: hypothetical protein Q9181_006108, partial [Wetmoreana brouardii]
MPPPAKKRKTGGVNRTKPSNVAPSPQSGIRAFGRISKSQASRPAAGKSEAKLINEVQVTVFPSSSLDGSTTTRKRKAQDSKEDAQAGQDPNKRSKNQAAKDQKTSDDRPGSRSLSRGVSHQKTPRTKAFFKSVPIETPTKGARSNLELLDLSSSPSSERGSSQSSSHVDTPASSPPSVHTPEPEQEAAPDLPEEIQDLIGLHSSFLTALSLHYTHHGSLTPADFRLLRPNIERSWRKRRVTIQDIQKILAIQQASSPTPPTLSLSDYSHSKICIEISAPSSSSTPHKRPLNEEFLNKTFTINLLNQWNKYSTTHPPSISTETFIKSLSLLPITPCTSSTALAPLLSKGQRRLEDLKAGAIKAQICSQHSTATEITTTSTATTLNKNSSTSDTVTKSPPPPTTSTTKARKLSLLDRIKAKQLAAQHSASSRTPLTPTQILRLAALRRIEEIVPVLELLASSSSPSSSSVYSQQIKSHTMPTIVQHLQMSLRNPIESHVAVEAVKVLAEEVCPG